MNNKNKESHGITRWLRRIFSLEFLGVVTGLVGLYFAYDAFIKDKPGELHLFNKSKICEDVRYIFYGFEIKGDSLEFAKAKNFPYIANYSNNPITDFSMVCRMKNNIGCRIDDSFDYYLEDDDSLQIPNIMMACTAERIGYMGIIPFPLVKMETRTDEIIIQHVLLSYLYQGLSEDVVNLFYFIVGIPPEYKENGITRGAEYSFIKAIRPYLLSIEDNEQIFIAFDDKTVVAPSKLDLLKEKEINVESINELQ